jgi:ABC-2 type transport system ATP-binding protein
VLFATHYLQEADDAADRVVVIAGGRKVADGPPGAIKARFGDRQVRFTLHDGPPGLLRRLAGVHTVDREGPRVTLHSSDTDATVASLIGRGSDGRTWTSAAATWRHPSCD